jgi:hypothetical protein
VTNTSALLARQGKMPKRAMFAREWLGSVITSGGESTSITERYARRNALFLYLIGVRCKVETAEFSAKPVEFYSRKAHWRMAVPRSLYGTGNGTVCRRGHGESGAVPL